MPREKRRQNDDAKRKQAKGQKEKKKKANTHCRCNHGTVNKPTKTGYRETAKPRNTNPFLSTPISDEDPVLSPT
jgi:hypothetical protein